MEPDLDTQMAEAARQLDAAQQDFQMARWRYNETLNAVRAAQERILVLRRQQEEAARESGSTVS